LRWALALEAAGLLAFALAVCAWFSGWPHLPAAVPLVLGLAAFAPHARWPARPHAEAVAVLAVAALFRLPALLHPWGWVNKDGAYGAFVTLHILQGRRPVSPFTEGANYQGTLKPHLAALLSPLSADLSWLMTAASLVLYLVFVAAAMALARRLGGRSAALPAGLWLALSPKFITTFSLNCVGQYVDVLALGTLALVLCGRMLDEDRGGAPARLDYLGIGLLLGAAFWQQPVALSFLGACLLALLLRPRTWKDPWALLVPLGLLLGVLPVLLWNAQNGWGSGDILGRDAGTLRAQVEALPHLLGRTLRVALPILVGLSPGHPWAEAPGVEWLVEALVPALLLAFVALQWRSFWKGGPRSALLPLLVMALALGLFWSVASGKVYLRPRYLLPLAAPLAVAFGVTSAALLRRSRLAAAVAIALVLAFDVAGSWPRLARSAAVAEPWKRLVASLERKGVKTGYADFTVAAPITMFTAERIVFSSRLGPTPAYESDLHRTRVERDGPDAFVLRSRDDPEAFASALRGLGVAFRYDPEPLPTFHALSRRVRVEEISVVPGPPGDATEE
jgi:hypothetical protein